LGPLNQRKSILFDEHLARIFTPNSNNNNDGDIEAYLNATCQISPSVTAFIPVEINNGIHLLNPHKVPGHLVVATILKNLPIKAILLVT
jgi:hypothetical protein